MHVKKDRKKKMAKKIKEQNKKIKVHPAAAIIPAMTAEDYGLLKEDIQRNGLVMPIILCDGMILDGRHRYQACLELGMEPKFTTYE